MKTYLQLFAVLFLFGISLIGVASDKNESKPNVLLIITDQQTANSMSCVGNPYVKTPAMDKLAEKGIRFERNFVSQPLCLPFRSSMQTGRYPHEIGTINNGEKIKGEFPMLGNLISDAGYKCDYIGKWHVGTSPDKAGYPDYDNVGKDDKKAIAAEKYLSQKHENPFFLTVSLMNPHNICQLARADAVGTNLPDGPIEMAPTNLDELPPLPDNFQKPENEPTIIREIQNKSLMHYPTADWSELTWRQYLWGYYRLVEKVDAEIGKVLNALEQGGHAKKTIVIFTSDHGEGVAMHHWNQKQILYEQVVRTPLLISWQGKTQQMVNYDLVSNALDIPQTILDVTGAEIPESMHGQSLLPFIEGKSVKARDFVIAETMFARGGENLGATGRMIRTKKYKYCIYDNGENREQFFDMENDPGETQNLVDDKAYASVLKKHKSMLEKWAQETNDVDFPYLR